VPPALQQEQAIPDRDRHIAIEDVGQASVRGFYELPAADLT